MARYDTLLLDLDGTLFDFDYSEHYALRDVLERRGYPFTPEVEARYRQINNALWARYDQAEESQAFQDYMVVERFAALLRYLGGGDDPAEMNREYLTRLGQHGKLLDGAEDFCREMAGHFTLAAVTNGVAVVQRSRLEPSSIAPFFSHVFISQELGFQKPRREFFDLVCERMDLRDRRRAVVQRSGITRERPALNTGWQAAFSFEVLTPEYIDQTFLYSVLSQAGRLIGVGDFRPSYGRYDIVRYEVETPFT